MYSKTTVSGKLRELNAQAEPASSRTSVEKVHYPFWLGGSASCSAVGVTHPLDLVKVRLQTHAVNGPKSMVGTFVHVVRNNGLHGLYTGLSAAMLRQLTYSTARFGIYEELKSHCSLPSSPSGPLTLLGMASASGFIGGVLGNPADVVNVRMQMDAGLHSNQRRNYRHAIDGLVQIIRQEGFRSLFRGIWPNSTRAALMTASQLPSYDTFKQLCIKKAQMKDNVYTHVVASSMAGFVATTICSPVDVIKTRVMSTSGSRDFTRRLRKVYATEGITWAFRGWVPSFIRLGPHTIVTFMLLEEHKRLYRYFKGSRKDDNGN